MRWFHIGGVESNRNFFVVIIYLFFSSICWAEKWELTLCLIGEKIWGKNIKRKANTDETFILFDWREKNTSKKDLKFFFSFIFFSIQILIFCPSLFFFPTKHTVSILYVCWCSVKFTRGVRGSHKVYNKMHEHLFRN